MDIVMAKSIPRLCVQPGQIAEVEYTAEVYKEWVVGGAAKYLFARARIGNGLIDQGIVIGHI